MSIGADVLTLIVPILPLNSHVTMTKIEISQAAPPSAPMALTTKQYIVNTFGSLIKLRNLEFEKITKNELL